MDVFLDLRATGDAVIRSGIAIFQYIYHAPGTTLGAIRYSMFSRKAAAGIIKPETLPPTDGAATQHSLHAYLQTRDWILLQSMSLDPTNYGWAIGAHGFEPIYQCLSLWPLRNCSSSRAVTAREIAATEGAAARKMMSIKCIAACGNCKGITCKNCIDDIDPEDESEELDMDYCYN